MPVLVLSPNGEYTKSTSLAAAIASDFIAGKTIVVTSPQVVTTALVIPSDVAFRCENGGYVTFTGAGALTGLKEVRPEWFGAKADGLDASATLNHTAFQSAVDALPNGGTVLVGDGKYVINSHIELKSNVALIGNGYASWIHNISQSAWERCAVVMGNVGDIGGGGGFVNETKYPLTAIVAGDSRATFVNLADVATFVVGDVVGIMSFEKWGDPPYSIGGADAALGVYINLNEITEITGTTIRLRYQVPDAYVTTSGNPTISRISGRAKGYPSVGIEWIPKNCTLKDLRITQAIATGGSFWYSIFPNGIGHHIENIWCDDCSSILGSNALGHSVVKNIVGSFRGGGYDFADFQVGNIIDNIRGNRINNNEGNVLGLSIHDGTDCHISNADIDFGCVISGTMQRGGYPSLYLMHRSSFTNSTFRNVGTSGVLLGFGEDCSIIDCIVRDATKMGIQIARGLRGRVEGNTIQGHNQDGTGNFGILILDAATEYTVKNNIIGIAGSRNTYDVIRQTNGFDPLAQIIDNITYETVRKTINPAASSSSGTATNAVRTHVFSPTSPVGSPTAVTIGYKFFASGQRVGTLGTKTVVVDLGGTVIATLTLAAADGVSWKMDGFLGAVAGNTTVRTNITGIAGITVRSNDSGSVANGFVNGMTLTVTGAVANAADTITIQNFYVVPVTEYSLV